MKTNYHLLDAKADRESAFLAIKRIDDFFLKNFSGFESELYKNGISSEADYFAFVSSDPSVEMSEKNRVRNSVNTLKKIKEFSMDYSMPRGGFAASSYMDIQESLIEQSFIQDTGLSIHVERREGDFGNLSINIQSANSKSLNLPFVIEWESKVMEDYEGNDAPTNIGAIRLLDGGERFPSLYRALSEFKFTQEPNVGLMSETGYSLNDLNDKSILMKVDIIDFSDTLEVLGFASNYQKPQLSKELSL